MTPQLARIARTLTPSQHVAMLADDLVTIRRQVLYGLARRGLARELQATSRSSFWAFTPLGRKLRAALRVREDNLEREYRELLGSWGTP